MVDNILQLVIVFVLFFVLLFGIGFILNMLLKTTWLPVYIYVFVLIPFVVYWLWEEGSLWSNLRAYSWPDYVTAFSGLLGVYLSGRTIRHLRKSGYKMF